jgi:hypothetical protein
MKGKLCMQIMLYLKLSVDAFRVGTGCHRILLDGAHWWIW